jgi:hypothetical protein
MGLFQSIQNYAHSIPAELKEKNGIHTLAFTGAIHKTFRPAQKITHKA